MHTREPGTCTRAMRGTSQAFSRRTPMRLGYLSVYTIRSTGVQDIHEELPNCNAKRIELSLPSQRKQGSILYAAGAFYYLEVGIRIGIQNGRGVEYPTVKISCAFEPKAEGTGQLPLSQISSNSGDSEFVITSPSVEPHLINSEEFDDLVRDLNLPKLKAEILGLMKQFVKALRQDSEAFQYLKSFFPKLSEAKIKAVPTKNKRGSAKAVIHGFLGNRKAENYTELITDMLHNFKVMGCRMSLKVHMLHAHLDKFKDNLGAYSEEQGERFHQDVMNFEKRYQGQYNENMMVDTQKDEDLPQDTPVTGRVLLQDFDPTC
ncbi:hypothetical protein EVAR_28997_1 [Eumeta japonica]|uniref:Uncharacterized protein n=1 Tax=Eumeta variegata TaxID=151549 RepID=A0A4C1W427_EUMVA|nr:hypothetical protein EVAR_28997_1 [Eumeta japonica]